MKLERDRDGAYMQVGSMTEKDRKIGYRVLTEMVRAGSGAAFFLRIKAAAHACSIRTLEKKREELLCEYVCGKILLFADKPSDCRIFKSNTEMDSVNVRVDEAYRKLLSTNLSKEAIAYRAKELALKLLNF